jgi:hypothetical protein
MFGHNSGTPGAISTELGTHMAVCMCKNLLYILYIFYLLSIIFSREEGVGGLHAIPPPGVTNRCRANVYADRYRINSPIVCVVLEHTNMRPFLFRLVNRALQLRYYITVKYLNFCVSGLSDSRLG